MVILGDQGLVNSLLLSTGLISAPLRLVNGWIGVTVGLVEVLILIWRCRSFPVSAGLMRTWRKPPRRWAPMRGGDSSGWCFR